MESIAVEGKRGITILVAEDDDDDFLLVKKAMNKIESCDNLMRVRDGEELVTYLKGCEDGDGSDLGRPHLILLDLNMPRMDGREALKVIKQDEMIKDIPITVFTTSKADEDILRSYQLGVNSFITKPVTYDGLAKVMTSLSDYWFKTVELPHAHRHDS